ncbi:MAG TPA: polysaccharide deacetylase family protein, partial [Thermoanaerobaculia bacterium]|nr:polysaccharide deacetylase family protein [Thermoanaerobaculia bacterium]
IASMARHSVLLFAAVLASAAATAHAAPAPVAPSTPPAAAPPTLQERLGYPADARLLVIHADDLGMAHTVNRATFEALENGWVTSASILVPCPWFPEVVRFAQGHPEADLGIHLALNSEWTDYRWRPVSPVDAVPSLLDEQGYLPLVEESVVARASPAEVERELRAQVDRARAAGIRVSHLDSHMATLFRSPALFDVYLRVGSSYGLPQLLEREGARNSPTAVAREDALLDRVVSINPGVPREGWLAAYRELLAPLPPGVYQLIVHLAYDDEEMRGATWDHPDWGAAWRQNDLDLVKSEAFRQFLREQGFVLVSWRDLGKARAIAGEPSRAAGS